MEAEQSRKRRRYSRELKAQVLAECDEPGASVAKVAMSHGINANILHGWRKLAPLLVDAGWRVIAPFNRGYAPSSLPSDGSFHIGALMDDALRVLDAVGPTGRDVIVGHDWGAMAGAGLAAMPCLNAAPAHAGALGALAPRDLAACP